MKPYIYAIATATALFSPVGGQTTSTTYTNFIRQVQLPSGVEAEEIDKSYVEKSGQKHSELAINPTGARFELHTLSSDPFASYLLDTRYVGGVVPLAEVTIRTEDTTSLLPRTRADRPFWVDVEVSGLSTVADDPDYAKKVKFLHHIQSYGTVGDGTNLDRNQATLVSQSFLEESKVHTFTFALSSVPGVSLSKRRGEERFTVFSLEGYQSPESQLSTQFVQIWPVADGTLSGITSGETIKFTIPTISIAVNDVYPGATIYAEIYPGPKQSGYVSGVIVPGSGRPYTYDVPKNDVLTADNWGSVLTADGPWTMVLLTSTPFGIDELDYVEFNVDRTISVNGSVTTIE